MTPDGPVDSVWSRLQCARGLGDAVFIFHVVVVLATLTRTPGPSGTDDRDGRHRQRLKLESLVSDARACQVTVDSDQLEVQDP